MTADRRTMLMGTEQVTFTLTDARKGGDVEIRTYATEGRRHACGGAVQVTEHSTRRGVVQMDVTCQRCGADTTR